MHCEMSRRKFISSVGAASAGWWLARPSPGFAKTAPTAPVAVAKCKTYGTELLLTLARMFDQLGGMERLVKGKTVAIKLNLTGGPTQRLGYIPLGNSYWVHPNVVGATIHLLGKAGARRIRLLESPWSTAEPLEEFMLQANWEPGDFLSAAAAVEFENTNFLGGAKRYSRFCVPGGGHMYDAYDLNHSYEDCDVFVSLAKLKEHVTAGVTLSMKNCFGITPCTIYGEHAGEDEPSRVPRGGRRMFHDGFRQPSKSAVPENDPRSPREGGYRVPRIVADLVAARPVHLAVIDGIESMSGGEGPWIRDRAYVRPGVLVAGTNCVTTDAVGTAVMGFDPMADRGTPPFEARDSTLRLAEEHGVGTRDLRKIEVVGTSIVEARFDFRSHRTAQPS
jgi:uncharacterized protein (DUF362 family)